MRMMSPSLSAPQFNLESEVMDRIERVENHSDSYGDSYVARARVIFKNGYQLSIIRGPFTYGAELGLFEIAIMNSQDQRLAHLWDEEDGEDTVCGYCSVEKVHHYIRKISQL